MSNPLEVRIKANSGCIGITLESSLEELYTVRYEKAYNGQG